MMSGNSASTITSQFRSQRPKSKKLSSLLVEEYHRSVLESGREPPAYHTFSDRYGGTKGIPFATRRGVLLKGLETASDGKVDLVQWCCNNSAAAETAGDFAGARRYLQTALEQLQGSVTGGVLGRTDVNVEQDRVRCATILFRLGKLAMRNGEHKEALEFFTQSNHVDPLSPPTYLLRASCYEHLENHASAYMEYEKYLSLSEPTMAVLAHTGQCALKAGEYEAAERRLLELLQMTERENSIKTIYTSDTCSCSCSCSCRNTIFSHLDSPDFYKAHAYYCLGCVKDARAAEASASGSAAGSDGDRSMDVLTAEKLLQEAHDFYELAASNEAYVAVYEDAVEVSISAKEAHLALENLRHLQHMRRNCARYYSRAADVCAMMGNTAMELEELSKALDQHQTLLERRETLLQRAMVYTWKLHNVDNAILDLSLLLSLPGDDYCTAMGHLERAKAFQKRSQERPLRSQEDIVAALRDYSKFVETALMRPGELPVQPECVTEAMLILATGAFSEKKYERAAEFFARAVARGWQPRELLPRRIPRGGGIPTNSSTLANFSRSSMPTNGVDLLGQMYVAIAHNVIAKHPVSEDTFKVAYEQRERPVAPPVGESKKSKAAERKEVEKPVVVTPAIGYQVVEEHYQRLRALEPTFFSSLQYELLEIWEPYRAEVERLREDLMFARGGKKVKRR